MWLNETKIREHEVKLFTKSLLTSTPNHVVIDDLFDALKLDTVIEILRSSSDWVTQQHTYSALYVDANKWSEAKDNERFVQRDVWDRTSFNDKANITVALEFLLFLRSEEFMALLSTIFSVKITDVNVANPLKNTNYFRLNATDFVKQHADDSPGRVVCMLLYLNKDWQHSNGGELVFSARNGKPIEISPMHNRCVLFDPFSKGSEHWVKAVNSNSVNVYRYNVTSWYWSE